LAHLVQQGDVKVQEVNSPGESSWWSKRHNQRILIVWVLAQAATQFPNVLLAQNKDLPPMSYSPFVAARVAQNSEVAIKKQETTSPTPKPYWREKESVFNRIIEDRYIAVSSTCPKITKNNAEVYHLQVESAGLVKAPLAFAVEQVWKFENLPKVSSHFTEANYDAKTRILFLHLTAYGFHAKMSLLMDRFDDQGLHEMRWRVVEGSFKGMVGTIRLESHDRRSTLVSLKSDHFSEKIPLPAVLMGVGVEIAAQKGASAMRQYLESENAL
jgi:hypothetical protein